MIKFSILRHYFTTLLNGLSCSKLTFQSAKKHDYKRGPGDIHKRPQFMGSKLVDCSIWDVAYLTVLFGVKVGMAKKHRVQRLPKETSIKYVIPNKFHKKSKHKKYILYFYINVCFIKIRSKLSSVLHTSKFTTNFFEPDIIFGRLIWIKCFTS